MTQAQIDSYITDFAQNSHLSVPVEISTLVYSKTFKW